MTLESILTTRSPIAGKQLALALGGCLGQPPRITTGNNFFLMKRTASAANQLFAVNTNNAQEHLSLGNAFCSQSKLHEGMACYRQALAIQPDYAEA